MNILVTLMLLPVPERIVSLEEVRKTKSWNDNRMVSRLLYFESAQGNMHIITGDVVLGEKFPHSMLFDFSWLIALQRA
jgi:hypothetical protein